MTLEKFLEKYGVGVCITIYDYCMRKKYDYTIKPEWIETASDMKQFEHDELSGEFPAVCLFLEPWWNEVKNRHIRFWNIVGGHDTCPVELCIQLEKEEEDSQREGMKVRELLNVVIDERDVFIKPNGKKTYYDGVSKDVPECLMDAVVTEINAKIRKETNEDLNNRYTWTLGIWVKNIKELDVITEVYKDFYDWSGEDMDAVYGDFKLHESELMADFENYKAEKIRKRFTRFSEDLDTERK